MTCIQDAGGNIKVINNSEIRDVLNRSKAASRAICDMPIAYEESIEKVEKLLETLIDGLMKKYPTIFAVRPSYLGVQTLDASSVNLRIVAEVEEKDVFSAQRIMNREFKLGFDKAGVEIPFTQVVVHQGK